MILPNIKSAKKRVLVSRMQNEKNRATKSALKTKMKKFDAALAESGAKGAQAAYREAVAGADKAAAKGVWHKNKAARKKSQLAKNAHAE